MLYPKEDQTQYRQNMILLLQEAQKESPPPDESTRKAGQRGRFKKDKNPEALYLEPELE